MQLLEPIISPISYAQTDTFYLQHPTLEELDQVITELQQEGLDLRRLVPTKNDSFESKGQKWLEREWREALSTFEESFPLLQEEKQNIVEQKSGLRASKEVLTSGYKIDDPFNIAPVELQKDIEELKKDQLPNSILVKKEDEIVGFGRLLEVEGNVEIVSLWTKADYRKRGIAGRVISELLTRSKSQTIFSFQTPDLVPYYLKQYNKVLYSHICSFESLPKPLQRDLFRMNIFWGPNTIIKIG